MTDELLITGATEKPPQGDDFENPTNEEAVEPLQPNTSYRPTDDEIGDGMINLWEGSYRYFFGMWHEYAGGVWQPVPRFERLIWDHLKELKHLGIRPSAHKVSSIEKYLQQYLWVDEENVDSLEYINLQNGLFNVATMTLEEHRQDVFLTSQLPFAYDEAADCPTFQRFLHETLVQPGTTKPDFDLALLVWEALGYSLTASTDLRASFWLLGESGTGKSVLVNVLQAMAGNSHVTIDLDQMNQNPYQLADIAGKRVVTFTEPKANSVLADNHYKRLVSQDTIMARQIFGKPFRFIPTCKVWGAMNELPRVVDRSDAIFNRVLIIPMNNRIADDKRDPRLTEKLMGELAGIFNQALRGLQRLRRAGGFTRCTQVDNARNEYKAENDIEAAFVDDWCERHESARISGQLLYDAYNQWCKKNGAYPKSSVKVARDWQRMGFEKKRSNGTWYIGVRLNQVGARYVLT